MSLIRRNCLEIVLRSTNLTTERFEHTTKLIRHLGADFLFGGSWTGEASEQSAAIERLKGQRACITIDDEEELQCLRRITSIFDKRVYHIQELGAIGSNQLLCLVYDDVRGLWTKKTREGVREKTVEKDTHSLLCMTFSHMVEDGPQWVFGGGVGHLSLQPFTSVRALGIALQEEAKWREESSRPPGEDVVQDGMADEDRFATSMRARYYYSTVKEGGERRMASEIWTGCVDCPLRLHDERALEFCCGTTKKTGSSNTCSTKSGSTKSNQKGIVGDTKNKIRNSLCQKKG